MLSPATFSVLQFTVLTLSATFSLCYVKFPWAKRPKQELGNSSLHQEFIKGNLHMRHILSGNKMAWISSAPMQQILWSYIEQGRLDRVLGYDPPQTREKCLTCLSGDGQGPIPVHLGNRGRVYQSLRGFIGSSVCSGPVQIKGQTAVISLFHTFFCDIENHGFRIQKALFILKPLDTTIEILSFQELWF